MRVLAVYFVVTGCLALPNALYALGLEAPDLRLWVLVMVPILHGTISMVAGLLLLKRTRIGADAPGSTSPQLLPLLLQLIGVYFVVGGVITATGPLIEVLLLSETWLLRGGELGRGIVELVAGVILILQPHRIARSLAPRAEPI
jgi:hypothetical protein